MDDDRSSTTQSRRDVLKKAAYVAPTILTLAASPAFAQRGSHAPVRDKDKDKDKYKDKD